MPRAKSKSRFHRVSTRSRSVWAVSGEEGRGFSPAAELGRNLGALAPEATRLRGLKAHSALRPEAAGLKPRPSAGFELGPSINATKCEGGDCLPTCLKVQMQRSFAQFTPNEMKRTLRFAQDDNERAQDDSILLPMPVAQINRWSYHQFPQKRGPA